MRREQAWWTGLTSSRPRCADTRAAIPWSIAASALSPASSATWPSETLQTCRRLGCERQGAKTETYTVSFKEGMLPL